MLTCPEFASADLPSTSVDGAPADLPSISFGPEVAIIGLT